jgi:cyanophycinase
MTLRATSLAGPIALVGSGEYLPQMEEIDRQLLARVGGGSARVVVLPTAAGLEEPSSPRRWAERGVHHFARLGAHVDAAHILVRQDAFDPHLLPLFERADFIYFSGGNPRHLVETLDGSPAWAAISARHLHGAVLAGCSAGAMAFGRVTLQPRRVWGASTLPADTWVPALGLVPGIVTLPHFDRWMGRMSEATLRQLAASLPTGVQLIGVDEDTALVRFDASQPSVWQVLGRRGVSVIDAERGQVRHMAGSTLELFSAPEMGSRDPRSRPMGGRGRGSDPECCA